MTKNYFKKISFLASFCLLFMACKKNISSMDENADNKDILLEAGRSTKDIQSGITFYALAGNMLDRYSTTAPESMLSSVAVTGLQAGEQLLGLDFRPRTAQLYA